MFGLPFPVLLLAALLYGVVGYGLVAFGSSGDWWWPQKAALKPAALSLGCGLIVVLGVSAIVAVWP